MLLMQDPSFREAKGLVAKVLLDFAREATDENSHLAQRDIATIIGRDWQTVHMSLKSLDHEGAIRIERNRITINKELLRKIARCSSE